MSIYVVTVDHGIYEIVRVDNHSHEVVQTNIRTREKADQACKIWQKRELAKDGRQNETGLRDHGREDGRHPDEGC